MHASYNLYLRVFAGAENYPDRLALILPDRSFTYGQLKERVKQAAAVIRTNGVDRNACVALDTRKSLPALTAALALSLLGCKWMVASREALNNPLLFITHLIQDGPNNLTSQYKTITMDEAWHSGRVPESKLEFASLAGGAEPERILVIGQSSGTTGQPKFFPITAENAVRRINPKYLLDPSPLPVVASMFHVLHAAIYFVLLRVFAKGGTLVFGIDKAHWQAAGVTMLMASPMHAAQIIEGRAGKASGKIPRVWLAGSPIYPAFLDQALDHFTEVVNAYGAMEASIVCHQVFKERLAKGDIVGVGSAMDDVVLEVVDESGHQVKMGEVGEVRYKTPLLVAGYIGDSATTRTFFRDGWFYPGDTGYLNANKQLFIIGRVNDLLNIGGTKLNAAMIDGIIQSISGIGDGACFTEPSPLGFDQLSIVVVAMNVSNQKKIAGELLKKLIARFRRKLLPTSIYFAETIPRNENGKVLRNLARSRAQSGIWRLVTPEKEQP